MGIRESVERNGRCYNQGGYAPSRVAMSTHIKEIQMCFEVVVATVVVAVGWNSWPYLQLLLPLIFLQRGADIWSRQGRHTAHFTFQPKCTHGTHVVNRQHRIPTFQVQRGLFSPTVTYLNHWIKGSSPFPLQNQRINAHVSKHLQYLPWTSAPSAKL